MTLVQTVTGIFDLPEGDWVANIIRAGGVFDQFVVDAAMSYIRPGSLVFDVGACFGQMSTIFARAVGPAGRVIAVEPNPVSAAGIVESAKANGIENLRVVPLAAWSESGLRLPFCHPPNHSPACFFVAPRPVTEPWEMSEVSTVTLDELRSDLPVSFIKIDAQGSDLRVLQGAKHILLVDKPAVIFEYESAVEEQYDERLPDYLGFMTDLGYHQVGEPIYGINYLMVHDFA